ncbi:MAG: rRNA (uridine2552-2-O)-methyltransferase [Actinomycetota bacterium]|nr:rRNA (uridine2552-2-O)-methyltransferase [Actinomycetota bacterium]
MNREERRRAARGSQRGNHFPGPGGPARQGQAAGQVPFLGLIPEPPEIHLTPLEHGCGCVIDWGWEPSTSDPGSFIAWCSTVVNSNCPWHGAASGLAIDTPPDATIHMADPGTGLGCYARQATGTDVQLGRELTRQLQALLALDPDDTASITAVAPRELLAAYREGGYDAPRAWLHSRITDVLLNRGASIENQLFDALRRRAVDSPDDTPPPGTGPSPGQEHDVIDHDPADDPADDLAPLTVGDLRALLASEQLPDDLPVIVGGQDFDDPGKTWSGLADAVWVDDQGPPGGRLCLAAMGLGLVATKDGQTV